MGFRTMYTPGNIEVAIDQEQVKTLLSVGWTFAKKVEVEATPVEMDEPVVEPETEQEIEKEPEVMEEVPVEEVKEPPVKKVTRGRKASK